VELFLSVFIVCTWFYLLLFDDFSESALEDEMTFATDEEMIVYMANCLVVKLQDKI